MGGEEVSTGTCMIAPKLGRRRRVPRHFGGRKARQIRELSPATKKLTALSMQHATNY